MLKTNIFFKEYQEKDNDIFLCFIDELKKLTTERNRLKLYRSIYFQLRNFEKGKDYKLVYSKIYIRNSIFKKILLKRLKG